MYGLSLEWKHCPDGVEVFDYGSPQKRLVKVRRLPPGVGLPSKEFREEEVETGPAGIVLRARTSRRFTRRLQVANLEDPVVIHFINARDDDARAAFLGAFGFLHADESETRIDTLKEYQAEMRRLLASAGADEPDVALLNKRLRSRRSDLVPMLDGRQLSFRLDSLYGLMLREIVLVVEKDARLASCDRCTKAFLTGPTTGRRSHAIYCSDRCRVAAMRARNGANN